jgi:hypothetical protein
MRSDSQLLKESLLLLLEKTGSNTHLEKQVLKFDAFWINTKRMYIFHMDSSGPKLLSCIASMKYWSIHATSQQTVPDLARGTNADIIPSACPEMLNTRSLKQSLRKKSCTTKFWTMI